MDEGRWAKTGDSTIPYSCPGLQVCEPLSLSVSSFFPHKHSCFCSRDNLLEMPVCPMKALFRNIQSHVVCFEVRSQWRENFVKRLKPIKFWFLKWWVLWHVNYTVQLNKEKGYFHLLLQLNAWSSRSSIVWSSTFSSALFPTTPFSSPLSKLGSPHLWSCHFL